MRVILHIIKKEYLQVFRDKAYIPMLFFAPIIQLTLFGYAAGTSIKNISTAIFDQDKTQSSREFIQSFNNSGYFRIKYYILSVSEIDELLDNGKVKLVINIPNDFEKRLNRDENADIQFIVDGSNSSAASIILGYISSIIQRKNNKIAIQRLERFQRSLPNIGLQLRAWYNPDLDNINFIVPGIICTILAILTTMLTSAAIVREREKGTLEQLMVSPIKSYQLILGKVLPFILIGFVDVVIVLLVGTLWFKVPVRGSIPLLFFFALIFLCNTLGTGILISTVSHTQQQAMMTMLFIMIPWVVLSGFIFPINNMPKVIQYLTYLIPLRYFLVIIRGIVLKGVGLSFLWKQALAMVILGTALLSLSITRFHKRLE